MKSRKTDRSKKSDSDVGGRAARRRRGLKLLGGGAILFFAIKGLITTSLLAGAFFGIKSCLF